MRERLTPEVLDAVWKKAERAWIDADVPGSTPADWARTRHEAQVEGLLDALAGTLPVKVDPDVADAMARVGGYGLDGCSCNVTIVADCPVHGLTPAEERPATGRSEKIETALRDIVEDMEARWDMSAASTNPGIKACVANAKAALSLRGDSRPPAPPREK